MTKHTPGPVKVTFEGDGGDVEECIERFMIAARKVFYNIRREGFVITFIPKVNAHDQ